MKKSFELKRIVPPLGLAAAAALLAAASCSQVADDCQLNVTCPEDGKKAAGGSGGGTSTSTSTTSSTSTGTGGMMLTCTPGSFQACYDGPPVTKDVGSCKSGQALCQPDGMTYGACSGAVKPTFDDCFTAADEDCDGKTPACTGTTVNAGAAATSTGDDAVFAVASDAAGNIYLGGVSGSGAKDSFFLASGAAELTKLDKTGAPAWKKTYPATGATSYSVVRGVAVDATGNLLVVGEYQGTIAASGLNLSSTMGSVDIFVLKLDSSGALLWSMSFGKDGDQLATSISLDSLGNIFITGIMTGSIDFGGGALVSVDGYDSFVAKLTPTGKTVWGKRIGDLGQQFAWRAAATSTGDVIVAGDYTEDINFGQGALESAGGIDIFLAKLDKGDGHQVWAKHFGDAAVQEASGVAVDGQDNIAMVGRVAGTTSFGGGNLTAPGNVNAFMARFDSAGTPLWSSLLGVANDDTSAISVAFDPADNLLITGKFLKSMTINGHPLTAPQGQMGTATDVFVAKLKGDGSGGWAYRFGDENDQLPWAITSDPLGNVIIGGTFQGTIDFGPPATPVTSQNNTYDAFWAKLAP